MNRKIIFGLSFLLTIFVMVVSCVGLLTPHFYATETPNWQAQCIGQDSVDLFLVVPCLILTSFLCYQKVEGGKPLWGGTTLYLTYTFTLYCFNVHFNKLFVLYCLSLGLSFYSFIYFLIDSVKQPVKKIGNYLVFRITSLYLVIVAVVFYLLWLLDIIQAVTQNQTPKSIIETGLFTNGVYVLDLSVILPAIFITGVLLLKRKTVGFLLTPAILTFFVLMDVTIAVLAVIMKIKGLTNNVSVVGIMTVLVLLSSILTIWYLKEIKMQETR